MRTFYKTSGLIITVMLTVIGSNLASIAAENDQKLDPPQFIENTIFIQPVNKPVYLTLKSDDKGSNIYFTTQTLSEMSTAETKYTKPILFDGYSPLSITAVSKKEGYEDSNIITKTYARAMPMPSIRGIKCNKIKKGVKKITGLLESLRLEKGSIRVEVMVRVKDAKSGYKTYKKMITTGKKGAKWTIKLKKALKKKDTVIVNCYSKDCTVRFTKSAGDNEMITVFVNAPIWKRIAKTI